MNARLLTTKEAAAFLGVKPKTLDVWRSTQRYNIPYVKLGGAIRYDLYDLEKVIADNKITFDDF